MAKAGRVDGCVRAQARNAGSGRVQPDGVRRPLVGAGAASGKDVAARPGIFRT
jgi:hypothetical protein